MNKSFNILAILLCCLLLFSCKGKKQEEVKDDVQEAMERADSIYKALQAQADAEEEGLEDEQDKADTLKKEEEKKDSLLKKEEKKDSVIVHDTIIIVQEPPKRTNIEHVEADEAKQAAAGLSEKKAPVSPKEIINELPGVYAASAVDKKPSFKGADASTFESWIAKSLRYPDTCKQEGREGKVLTSFVVSRTGKVINVQVLKSSGNESFDEEAIRVISDSPAWTPAEHRGEAVDVQYTVPVNFRLN